MVVRAEQEQVRRDIELYTQILLQPAQIAPPSIDFGLREAVSGPVVGRARPVLAEQEAWNSWNDGLRLFNHRMGHLFEVRIEAPGPLVWSAGETTLELNDDSVALRAAPVADLLFEDLLFWADQQELFVLDGDLVARTRAAGAFRSAYLPSSTDGSVLSGLVGFPLRGIEDGDRWRELAEMHVVAVRLTVVVATPDGRHELSWVFD